MRAQGGERGPPEVRDGRRPDRGHRPPFRRRSGPVVRRGRRPFERGLLQLVAELDGAPEGRPDRLREDRPQPARLELVERGRGGPARRRDHVAQLGRMHARLLREERRALERLDHQVVGDVAREAEVDGRVDERLHDEEDVGRAGTAHRGRHRDHLLVVDLELGAQRPEERRRLLALRVGRLGRRVPDRHALAEAGRRVGHAADDLVVAEDAGEGGRRGAGQDAQDELPAAQVRTDLAADPGQHLGLDPEEDDVGAFDGLGVVGDRADPVLACEVLTPLVARMAGDHLTGIDQLAAEQPGDHRLGHHAGTDRRDRGLREG